MSLGHKLRESCRSNGLGNTLRFLSEAKREGKITDNQISLRNLAEGLLGSQWYESLSNPGRRVLEGSDAVDASTFSAITGQLLVDRVKEAYQYADRIGESLVSTESIGQNLGEHKEPWLSRVNSMTDDKIQPGMPYPHTQFSPNYITYPAPVKYGQICAITLEMVRADLTKQAMDRASGVGESAALFKEELILKVVTGVTNNHSWNGTAYNTYQTTTPWINKVSSTTLNSWQDVAALEKLLWEMTDPDTGKPIMIKPTGMLVMPENYYHVKNILKATNVRTGDYPTSAASNVVADSPNPLEADYPVLKSNIARQLVVASGVSTTNVKHYVYLGDFKKAFVWREVEPMQVFEAPAGNPDEFHRDIAVQVKVRLWGVAAVRDPRYVVQAIDA